MSIPENRAASITTTPLASASVSGYFLRVLVVGLARRSATGRCCVIPALTTAPTVRKAVPAPLSDSGVSPRRRSGPTPLFVVPSSRGHPRVRRCREPSTPTGQEVDTARTRTGWDQLPARVVLLVMIRDGAQEPPALRPNWSSNNTR